MAMRESTGRRVFVFFNTTFLILLLVMTLFPFVNVIAGSFSTSLELLERPFMLFPHNPTLFSYRYIFSTQTFVRALMVSAYITVTGTIANLVLTFLTAYPLSQRKLFGKKILMNLVVFTMMFSGGMIPGFLNIKSLGLINSFWALILVGGINTYNLIIAKNFIQQIPDELKEAARIDGANELFILWRVILPLSLPILATLGLFYAVSHWNNYFNCLLYINDSNKWNVQVLLRQIVAQTAYIGDLAGEAAVIIPEGGIKCAAILVSTVPIVVVYPFLQKHFTKGALLGAVKG
ncbi:MAG: carbohydrate ABC transporter permease [Treponema sp.]|jgi:putative aldouronate transport system permease protein|nr:carbohydrate ABC transporter permease [Treponema sp.]